MLEYTDTYIQQCLDLNILTTETIRAYPLRKVNLAVVLKAYAIASYKPYTFNHTASDSMPDTGYYLTDAGTAWLLDVFSQKTLDYLRSNFQFVFAKAKAEDIVKANYEGYGNFFGVVGARPKAGTKQGAVIVRTYKRTIKEFPFETLKEARQELMNLLRFYPMEQFKLYRIHKQGHRIGVPLVLDHSDRGAHLRK